MAVHDTDYYSEHALNRRKLDMTAQREKARLIREALARQHDAMAGPKPIRGILTIVPPTTSKSVAKERP